jgi:hypothetical protein
MTLSLVSVTWELVTMFWRVLALVTTEQQFNSEHNHVTFFRLTLLPQSLSIWCTWAHNVQ